MPQTYDQDGKGKDAVAYLHYFAAGACNWFIPFKLTEPRDMAVLIEHLPHDQDNANLWHHVRISGPGEV